MAAPWNLAIETSGRHGSVSLGRGEDLLASRDLPEQRRHAIGLMPEIAGLCDEHGAAPADLGEVYVSVGPGSFTGLRVGVTVAKALAWARGARPVAVPTLDAIAANADPRDGPADAALAVMLNAKGGRYFVGVFDKPAVDAAGTPAETSGGPWRRRGEPGLMTPGQLCETVGRALRVIVDQPPDYDWPQGVELLSPAMARARSEAVWRIGRDLADAGCFTDPYALSPLYIRLPDAEEKWRSAQPRQTT